MSDISYLVGDQLILLDGPNVFISDVANARFTEFLNLQDAPRILVGEGYQPADTLALTDGVTVKFLLGFLFGEATDTTAPDQIVLLDSVLIGLDAGRIFISVQDGLNFNDLRQSRYTQATLATDTLALSDFMANLLGGSFTDSLSLTDAITVSLDSIFSNFSIGIADTLNLSDSLQLITSGAVRILISERIRFFDSVSVTLYSNNIPYLRRYLNDVVVQ